MTSWMSGPKRVTRYLRSLVEMRRHTIPLNRHNLRALWAQSEPGWLEKLPPIDVTDEEWESFMEAL